MRLLFWNTQGNCATVELVAQLARVHNLDTVVLAESEQLGEDALYLLQNWDARFQLGSAHGNGIHVLTRTTVVKPIRSSNCYHLLEMPSSGEAPLLLAAVHLPSQLYQKEEDIAAVCHILHRDIVDEESKLSHRNTIVLGDFNLDPFSAGMNAVTGMNAVHSGSIASRTSRTFSGVERLFFYNPMWRFMHDAHAGPPGTCYYSESGVRSMYWHTFDQVLLRPQLVDRLRPDSLAIITEVAGVPLKRPNGKPDRQVASDHFPSFFELEST